MILGLLIHNLIFIIHFIKFNINRCANLLHHIIFKLIDIVVVLQKIHFSFIIILENYIIVDQYLLYSKNKKLI